MGTQRDTIYEDDTVYVYFGSGEDDFIKGKVIAKPCQPGDVWIIQSERRLYYCERPILVEKDITNIPKITGEK